MAEKFDLQIQTILYHNDKENIIKSIKSLIRAVEFSISKNIFKNVILRYGDCSSIPLFSDKDLNALNEQYSDIIKIDYTFFNENLGSAKGNNQLAKKADSDYIIIMNPDILMAPDIIRQLYNPFKDKQVKVGLVEARQLPIEHPKDYDLATGETSWASTACVLFPKSIYDSVGGFDDDTFFLYCDDVDFSWMIRLKGYKIIFQPSAVIFHDKTLSRDGKWKSSPAEEYYSAEAMLLMSYKWSYPNVVEKLLKSFESSKNENHKKAAEEFKKRAKNGELPDPRDPKHNVGEIIKNNYGKMRFSL